MVNFTYLIGDRETGEAVAVDPAYDVGGLLDVLAADGLRLTGVLATHYHADHCGGDIMGYAIEGVRELLARDDGAVPIHVQRAESEWVKRSTGVSDSDLVQHDSGDVVHVGAVPITLVHTPGHTPGSQCFLVDDRLVAGDTLFLEGCGRTDLPGSDPDAMYESLTKRLATRARLGRALPRSPLLPRAVGLHGRHPARQLRVPGPEPGAVAPAHGALSPRAVTRGSPRPAARTGRAGRGGSSGRRRRRTGAGRRGTGR